MCRPQHFAVTYSINPWMDPQAWAGEGDALAAKAAQQWSGLHRALLKAGVSVQLVDPEPGLPDLVFTANAAIVLDGKALLARFRHPERRGEEPVFAAAFRNLQARGLLDAVVEGPQGLALEGAGDCIWDRARGQFWMGSGPRSDKRASKLVEKTFGVRCLPLELVDPSFYHLDTAFCVLPGGELLHYPGAFSAAGLKLIHEHIPPEQRIALDREDADRFAANAVGFDRTIVLSSASEGLRRNLEQRGYKIIATPLDMFLRSGGSACCLTLRLDHRSQAARPSALVAAE